MSAKVGAEVVDVLEQVGGRYLGAASPEIQRVFLLQVGGADTLRRYDGTEVYWNKVQAILDCFFDSAERAEIASSLVEILGLRESPECRDFVARMLAECRVQELIAAVRTGIPAG